MTDSCILKFASKYSTLPSPDANLIQPIIGKSLRQSSNSCRFPQLYFSIRFRAILLLILGCNVFRSFPFWLCILFFYNSDLFLEISMGVFCTVPLHLGSRILNHYHWYLDPPHHSAAPTLCLFHSVLYHSAASSLLVWELFSLENLGLCILLTIGVSDEEFATFMFRPISLLHKLVLFCLAGAIQCMLTPPTYQHSCAYKRMQHPLQEL